MAVFVVTYTHPDEAGWHEHVGAHVDWLAGQVEVGRIRASGPFAGTPVRSAMLIIEADNRENLEEIIASDPFHAEDVIGDMTVTEWEPIFGVFAQTAEEMERRHE